MKKLLIILGAGGHAHVLVSSLKLLSANILGLTDVDPLKAKTLCSGLPILGGDDVVLNHSTDSVELINGLGTVSVSSKRRDVFESFKKAGFHFGQVIHPSVIIDSEVTLGEGVQLMAGVVIQPGCHIGKNVLINSRAVIDHDCSIGDHVHVATGATLSGGVSVGEGSHIGTGAVIIQGIRIGKGCLIAAGAVVVKDVEDGLRVAGVPARNF